MTPLKRIISLLLVFAVNVFAATDVQEALIKLIPEKVAGKTETELNAQISFKSDDTTPLAKVLGDEIEVPVSDPRFEVTFAKGETKTFSMMSASVAECHISSIVLSGDNVETAFSIAMLDIRYEGIVISGGVIYYFYTTRFTLTAKSTAKAREYHFTMANYILNSSNKVIGGREYENCYFTVTDGAPPSTNLVHDPEFDYGWQYWGGYVDPRDAEYTTTFDNNSVLSGRNSLKVDIKKAGSVDWYITMFTNLPIQKNNYYEIRFKAKLIGRSNKNITIRFSQGQDPWKDYGGASVKIDNTKEDFGPFYLQANTTDPVARFNFHFGGGGTNNIVVYIDQVYVAEYIPSAPTPDFTAIPLAGNAPLTVKFTDVSLGWIQRRTWDFGDGKSSTAINPRHTFEKSGNYDIKLTLIGVSGDTVNLFKKNYITVTSTSVENELNSFYSNSFLVDQNYPNPFNPTTTISYALESAGKVTLTIYNLQGAEIKTLVNENQSAGVHQIQWDGTNHAGEKVASGLYLYTLRTGTNQITKRMLLVK